MVQLIQKISNLDEGEFTVYACDKKPPRTLAQNRYLWGVVYKTLSNELGYDVEVIHDYCKRRFGLTTKFSLDQGEYLHPSKRGKEFYQMSGMVCEVCEQDSLLTDGDGEYICTNDECGVNYSINEDEFKMLYNPVTVEEITKSTKAFDTKEMTEYIDKIITYSSTELNINIPAPGELTEEQYIQAMDTKY